MGRQESPEIAEVNHHERRIQVSEPDNSKSHPNLFMLMQSRAQKNMTLKHS